MQSTKSPILIQPSVQEQLQIVLMDGTRIDLPLLGSLQISEGHLLVRNGGEVTGAIAAGTWLRVESVMRQSTAPGAQLPTKP